MGIFLGVLAPLISEIAEKVEGKKTVEGEREGEGRGEAGMEREGGWEKKVHHRRADLTDGSQPWQVLLTSPA
jgi:hypothetical protein